MNELDAIHLSESHGLGSPRNTLVPGVAIPAYVPGTDPNKWIATVKAIGIASHTPSSSGYSFYKPVADAVGSLPGYSGLDNTTIQRKSPEEQAQVVAKLADVLSRAGGESGANRFASGNWIFGNDFGGMQSAKLADDAQEFREIESNRNFNLQSAAQAFRQNLEQAQLRRSEGTDAWRQSQDVEANRLALLDRLSRLTQQDFSNQLDVSKLNSELGYDAAYKQAGNAASDARLAAYPKLTSAQSVYNERMVQEAEAWNQRAAKVNGGSIPDEMRLVVTEGPNGVAQLKGGKMAGSGVTDVTNIMMKSQEAMELRNALNDLQAAQVAKEKVAYTPRPRTTTPQLPPLNFNAEPLLELLTQYGFNLVSVPNTTQQVSKTGSVGYFDPKTGQLIRY